MFILVYRELKSGNTARSTTHATKEAARNAATTVLSNGSTHKVYVIDDATDSVVTGVRVIGIIGALPIK